MLTGQPVADDTARWIATLDQAMLDKLAGVGLIAPREAAVLGTFLDSYFAGRTDVKARTIDRMKRAAKHLREFFGDGKLLREIGPGDVEEFARSIRSKVGENTSRRRLSYCKQFFRFATRKRLIPENPFDDLKNLTVGANRERDYFVLAEDAQKVLNACPSIEWRVIVALARFGAFRTPSETFSLKWSDIDWDRERVTVSATKTGQTRVMPLFPELKPYLQEAWDAAPEGAEFVVSCRDTEKNLRTHLCRIIRRAGLKPWPKLFQNLRQSRATELAARFPQLVAAEWCGHSAVVAQKHYWRVTDADFERAIREPTAAPGSALQNPVQQPSEMVGNDQQAEPAPAGISGDFPLFPTIAMSQHA